MPATILICGFGRFPGAARNPTAALVRQLARRRRPALADLRRPAHVFATAYAAVNRQLPALIARHRPQAIIMFGLAARARHLRVEIQARNIVSTLFPDATGHTPARPRIRRDGPACLRGRAPMRALLAAARAGGVKAALSRDAGRYVCNYLYWRAIEQSRAASGPRLVVFVHTPPVSGPRRRLRFCALARAAEAILVAAAGDLRRSGQIGPKAAR